MIANISTKPRRLAVTAVSVIQPFVISIIIRLPKNIISELTSVLRLWLSDWAMVSTSFVTRESTSPVLVLL